MYGILGIKCEQSEKFLEHLKEESRRAEEMQKLTLRLAESERELRKISINILENGTMEDKVNLLASKYLGQLKFEQEKEEQEWKKKMEKSGIKM